MVSLKLVVKYSTSIARTNMKFTNLKLKASMHPIITITSRYIALHHCYICYTPSSPSPPVTRADRSAGTELRGARKEVNSNMGAPMKATRPSRCVRADSYPMGEQTIRCGKPSTGAIQRRTPWGKKGPRGKSPVLLPYKHKYSSSWFVCACLERRADRERGGGVLRPMLTGSRFPGWCTGWRARRLRKLA